MADRMTQAQLVAAIADQNEISKAVAKNFLVSLSEIATKETKKNGEFTIPGVGKLVRRESKARMGRNPAAGTVDHRAAFLRAQLRGICPARRRRAAEQISEDRFSRFVPARVRGGDLR